MKVIKQTKPIIKTSPAKIRNTKIITMDIETILINNEHIPYLLCWYDGINTYSYIIRSLDTMTLEYEILKMFNDAIEDINIRKYKNYKIYMHNFSKFDGYFMLKYLTKIGYCDPVINKGKIITVNFKKFNDGYPISFRDSYLLLPSSLRSLSNSFNVETKKSIFPFKFGAAANVRYNGMVPDFRFFDCSLEEYNTYSASFDGKIWNFIDEAEKYCNIDCISLYEILTKFNQMIFDKFKLNINNYPTLPSLSFGIFRTHYLKDDSIHMISGNIDKDIRESYTGGSVDMYKPRPAGTLNNTKIFAYDVNSLYPNSMKNYKMPVGSPTYFEGNILNYLDRPASWPWFFLL